MGGIRLSHVGGGVLDAAGGVTRRSHLEPEQLRAELAEMDKLVLWRTRQTLAEFENAWREALQDRKHVVPWAELQRRRGEGRRCWNCGASNPIDNGGA